MALAHRQIRGPEGGRHRDDVAGCKDCGTELEPKEEPLGVCNDCLGRRQRDSEKESARMGKGIRDYIDLVKAIKRTPVDSSNLKSVGYDPASRKLHVGFHYKGAVYEYHDVSPSEHKALMSAPSIGEHFAKHIRKNKEYQQIKSSALLVDIEKARSKPWKSKKGKRKVERTMHEWGEGSLRSGSKHGPVVTDQKQAVAIALAQARKAGRKKSLNGIVDYIIKARR